jgi:hypothetical protein
MYLRPTTGEVGARREKARDATRCLSSSGPGEGEHPAVGEVPAVSLELPTHQRRERGQAFADNNEHASGWQPAIAALRPRVEPLTLQKCGPCAASPEVPRNPSSRNQRGKILLALHGISCYHATRHVQGTQQLRDRCDFCDLVRCSSSTSRISRSNVQCCVMGTTHGLAMNDYHLSPVDFAQGHSPVHEASMQLTGSNVAETAKSTVSTMPFSNSNSPGNHSSLALPQGNRILNLTELDSGIWPCYDAIHQSLQ